ncbi:MAG: hypothetical protein KME07_18945 [Pegethrix bostrychoides GSE-TBD4-15B]|jgi:hypothetical protein|uniref:DUF8166 domain-containing protein n=1 Tax=Pegethrix bostrychoides GSE-TBD4-15B TaxID=2839662 RepID=A0A951PEF1_9CYAN|nr:hypothetical protein [Pegethrix bostrychoides GSE-TBD4-15B]
MRLGKVVKSNSHCDYVIQLDDQMDVSNPPQADDYGFGCFVKLESPGERHWAVGMIYNSQLFNPMFLSSGPRLSSEPDPLFAPDLIVETRTLLGVVLIGTMVGRGLESYGVQGIPRVVVPVNSSAFLMDQTETYRFHLNEAEQPQFCYFSHLLKFGGSFASQLTQQVLKELTDSQMFSGSGQRALEILYKELSWKNTMSAMR